MSLREADTSYIGDNTEVFSAVIIITQSDVKYSMNTYFI